MRSIAAALITAVLLAGCSSGNNGTSDEMKAKNTAFGTARAAACKNYPDLLVRDKSLAASKAFNKMAGIDDSYTELAVSAYQVMWFQSVLNGATDMGSPIDRAPLLVEMWKSFARISQYCELLSN